ncbi:AraC family transcriptional regulator [uncultured Intestinimonas sp.]|uniref:AraC family transcriptional regulator n=1 Tax=uncultured Intestinimonas sp. TaxID=1689265 RepID=UPI0029423CB6|nr:AraC family transcriptional regulator [uncultured Intestinimonas sp.]
MGPAAGGTRVIRAQGFCRRAKPCRRRNSLPPRKCCLPGAPAQGEAFCGKGYDEPNYFSYVFKKRFGVSPSQFRK